MDSESLYDEHDETVDSGYLERKGCDMKTLFLIRHAKSSWDDAVLPDRDRPLDDRGERDVAKMGKRLVARNVKADLIMSSPAKRALATAEVIAKMADRPHLTDVRRILKDNKAVIDKRAGRG